MELESIEFQDKTLVRLANHLKESINEWSSSTIGKNLVNTVKYYDATNIGRQECPVLKVFRINSEYGNNNKRRSTIAISYVMTMPEMDKIATYTDFLSRFIQLSTQELLTKINVRVDPRIRVRNDYRLFVGENTQQTFPTLNVYLTIIESVFPDEIINQLRNQ